MPAGCLVTKDTIDFDVGMWQCKTYEKSYQIYDILRSKWTPHTINLIIIDDDATFENIKNYVTSNSFEINQRYIYLVYCIAIKTEKVTNELANFLKTRTYPMNSYHNKLSYNGYTIFVCDFVKNLLLY